MDLWKSALVMINDSPFRGWGYKLGGMMYQNWYQPLWHTTRPIGFVNSYLEVAVEQGSHVLFLVVVCACALLLLAVKFRRVAWVAAAGASLAAWLVCNVSSSIWLWPGLWILPAVAVLCIVLKVAQTLLSVPGFKVRALKIGTDRSVCATLGVSAFFKIMLVSLTAGLVAWTIIIGAGRALAKDEPFQARPAAHGDAAIIARRGRADVEPVASLETPKPPESRTELWVDAAVTGRYWGKAIRTILENNPSGSFIVYAPWALRANRLEPMASRFVYSGFQAELSADKISGKEQIIILHPTVYPPTSSGNANLLIGPPSQTGDAARRHANQEIGVPRC